MAKVVSFINYKGGVGKTTLAVELAASLAYKKRKRVLLADLDPQTNATFYLMKAEDWETWSREHGTLKNLFAGATALTPLRFDIRQAIVRDLFAEQANGPIPLHLLPSHLDLMMTEIDLTARFGARSLDGRRILRLAFEPLKDDYDYIVCDCPPNLNLITQNAILASDSIMIVAMAEHLSTIGIEGITRAIERLIEEVNTNLRGFVRLSPPAVKGIIFNRVSTQAGGTMYEQTIVQRIRERYPELVFKPFVSRSINIAQCAEPSRTPIAISGYAADRVYEQQIAACADEFIRRIEE